MTDALEYFNRFYEPAKRHQDAMADQWDEYEKAYLAEPEGTKPKGVDSWRTWLFFKYGWQQVQTLVAELAADDDPTFVWEARTQEHDQYAGVVQAIVGYQLQRDHYADKRFMALLTAAVYGGCPVKVHWRYDKVDRVNPVSKQVEKVCVADHPTMTLVDPRDFFYDLRARSMRDARFAFHRMRLTIEELKARKRADGSPMYSNLSDLENGDAGRASDGTLDNDHSGERDRARRQGVEVIEMWTRERVIVRAGGVIIRDEPNPYRHGRLPFEVITLLPSLNDVWGVSLMWVLRDVQALLHTLDNASTDALKLAINPPLAIDISDDADNAERPLIPGQRFPSRSPKDAVEPVRVTGTEPFVNQGAIQALRDQLEYNTGITREVAGQSNVGTATQAALNQRQAKGRIGIMLRHVDSAFARIAEMFLGLNQQFLDLSVPVKVMGPGGAAWKPVAPSEIAGVWDVRPKNSSERVVKELQRQNLMEALSAMLPANTLPLPSGKTVDVTPILEDLAESFDVPKERVLVPSEQMHAEQGKAILAQAQAQSQAQQMMQPPTPENPPNLIQAAQAKLFQSVNYKDLPDAAQAAMLSSIGLPNEGVQDDNRNPTRPNAGQVNPISEGLLAHSAATRDA